MKDLKFYYDNKCTQEIKEDLFNFGLIQAGDTKTYEFFIKNIGNGSLSEMQLLLKHPEIKIIEFPKELRLNEIKKVVLQWASSVTLEEGIDINYQIVGKKRVGPNL